jgi:hypothetical protein
MENWSREAAVVGFQPLATASSTRKHQTVHKNSVPLYIHIVSWAKIPTPNEIFALCNDSFSLPTTTGGGPFNYIVVADEAHAMQTITSSRTRSALSLCKHPKCIGVLLSTGTPMKNGRPCNLYPLLSAISHPLARNQREYEMRYCNAKKTIFCPWDISGVSNLPELKDRVGSSLQRKTKV